MVWEVGPRWAPPHRTLLRGLGSRHNPGVRRPAVLACREIHSELLAIALSREAHCGDQQQLRM